MNGRLPCERHLWAGMRQPAPAAVGTLAGLLLAGLPLTTWYAQDARPYALASLCAIGASWLLVRGTAARSWWWWAGYAAVMALLGWLSLYALLLLPAHATSLLLSGRFREDRVVARRWLIGAASACVVVAPLLLLGASQAGTLAWIQRPTMSTVYGLVFDFSGAKRLTSDRPDNLREVAAVVQAYGRPGDAVVYLPWDTRVVGFAYPAPFRRLDDIGLARSPEASDTLDGTEVRAGVLTGRIAAEPRVWTVRWTDTGTSAETAQVLSGLRLLRSWRIGSVLLGLYVPRAG